MQRRIAWMWAAVGTAVAVVVMVAAGSTVGLFGIERSGAAADTAVAVANAAPLATQATGSSGLIGSGPDATSGFQEWDDDEEHDEEHDDEHDERSYSRVTERSSFSASREYDDD